MLQRIQASYTLYRTPRNSSGNAHHNESPFQTPPPYSCKNVLEEETSDYPPSPEALRYCAQNSFHSGVLHQVRWGSLTW